MTKMSGVDNILNRLENIWKQLLNSDVVVYHSLNNNALNEFRKIINASVGITEKELTIGDVYRNMYRKNNKEFCEYVKKIGCEYVSLMTDGILIAKLLGVFNIVHIQWSVSGKQFIVNRFGPKPSGNIKHNQGFAGNTRKTGKNRPYEGQIISKRSNFGNDMRYIRYNTGKPRKIPEVDKMINILENDHNIPPENHPKTGETTQHSDSIDIEYSIDIEPPIDID